MVLGSAVQINFFPSFFSFFFKVKLNGTAELLKSTWEYVERLAGDL